MSTKTDLGAFSPRGTGIRQTETASDERPVHERESASVQDGAGCGCEHDHGVGPVNAKGDDRLSRDNCCGRTHALDTHSEHNHKGPFFEQQKVSGSHAHDHSLGLVSRCGHEPSHGPDSSRGHIHSHTKENGHNYAHAPNHKEHQHIHGECCSHANSDARETVTQSISLTGMDCADCATRLEKAVSRLEEVSDVQVVYATSNMQVRYSEGSSGYDRIVRTVRNLGYDVSEASRSMHSRSAFAIEGMDCADCAQKLERKIGALAEVSQVSVNYGAATMTVEHNGTGVPSIIRAVSQAGYTAVERRDGRPSGGAEQPFWKRNKKVLPTAIAGVLFASGWLVELSGIAAEWVIVVLFAASIVIGGFRIARSGIYGLKSRTIGMDLLMTLAAVGAAAIGEWGEGAAVVFLFSLGETLEAYTMDRTRRSIRGLMDLAPQTALVRRGAIEQELPVEQIGIGDTILVKSGEKVAMDGIVRLGASAVNQAPITGESIPAEKRAGDEVFAGTINGHGSLEIEVTKLSKDNTLSRIIHMVEEAQAQKAPSQRFVDVFAKYYTPAVIVVALGIACIPPLFPGQLFSEWFYRALMMLVVSCPCALVISTPVSIVSAIGNAARNGILIKGGAHLERLGAVSAIAFDKTGTLTMGTPQVTRVVPMDDTDERSVLALAVAIECHSEHPLAQAIVRKAEEEHLTYHRGTDFVSATGNGAQAVVEGELHLIGRPKWFVEQLGQNGGESTELLDRCRELEQKGQTVMVIGTREQAIGIIAVADQVRSNGRQVVQRLREVGLERIVMLTGDNEGTARAVADSLGGLEYRAELLPQDKVSHVKELMSGGAGAAMVGDGVNDAPALATATVGIAMGAAGSDTALETADVALMADDLEKLPYAIRLSRRALAIIKQNIAFSLLVKAVFLLLIFFGVSTLWLAVLADTGSSLLVILNGMRLLRKQQA